ncbi:MAG: hypothetical protein JO297_10335 [Nitrososphaeraceae archaeon]|nr:hypothetical protein [Nitrososphaeraceae archaeon]
MAEKAPIGLLIYPKFEEEIEKEYEIKNTDKRIVLKTIDLSANDRAEFNKKAAKFLSDIKRYINNIHHSAEPITMIRPIM